MPDSAIGSYVFATLTPRPAAPAQRVVMESQAGKLGVALYKTGVRGSPTQHRTVVDVSTFSVGEALCDLYRGLMDAGPQTLIYNGVTESFSVQVIDVVATPKRTVVGIGPGGKTYCQVEATWTLLPWN